MTRRQRRLPGYSPRILGGLSAIALSSSIVAGRAVAQSSGALRAAPVSEPPLVLDRVNVVDVQTGQVRPAQRVVVVGNRIRAVGRVDKIALPRDARVVDARGRYLIPGLWDMHVHPWDYADLFYPLFVSYGVTGVRDAGSNTPLATFARWKQEIAAGARVGPRLFVAGPSINQCEAGETGGAAHQICVSTASEARLVVDFLKLAGADFIKPYMLSRELYLAIAAEARRIGIPFGGHTHNIPGLEASDSGASFLDHQTWFNPNVCGELSDQPAAYDRDRCAAAADQLRRNNTWVVETPGGVGFQLFPEVAYELVRRFYPDSAAKRVSPLMSGRDSLSPGLPRLPTSVDDWKAALLRPSNLMGPQPWAHDSTGVSFLSSYGACCGMPIVAGTDAAPVLGSIPGYTLHQALVYFVLTGMTPLEALQTATLNPAKAMHLTDSLGIVAAGKLADLVLLDADPLVDIWNTTRIRAVIANGRYFDRAALDRLLQQVERATHPAAARGSAPRRPGR